MTSARPVRFIQTGFAPFKFMPSSLRPEAYHQYRTAERPIGHVGYSLSATPPARHRISFKLKRCRSAAAARTYRGRDTHCMAAVARTYDGRRNTALTPEKHYGDVFLKASPQLVHMLLKGF